MIQQATLVGRELLRSIGMPHRGSAQPRTLAAVGVQMQRRSSAVVVLRRRRVQPTRRPPSGAFTQMQAAGGRVVAQREARRRAWLSSAAARSQRWRSRSAFRHLSRRRALRLAVREFPGVVGLRAWHGLVRKRHERVVRFLSSSSAVVSDGQGHRGVAFSQVPLLGRTPQGHTAPVNLALSDRGSYFAPLSASTPVELPKDAGGSASFPDLGARLFLDGTASSRGQLVSDHVAMGDVYTDTDAFWQAIPRGMELSYQLRSPASPHQFVVRLGLRAGDSLSLTASSHPGGLPGAAEVDNAQGQTLLFIPPAEAVDAQGSPISTSYSIDAGKLVMSVKVPADVAYPVMVDPPIYNVWGQGNSNPYPAWQWYNGNPGPPSMWGATVSNNALYLWGNTNLHYYNYSTTERTQTSPARRGTTRRRTPTSTSIGPTWST